MKILKAQKDSSGYHYMIQLDETLPANGTNIRQFEWSDVPEGKITGNPASPTWTEKLWIQMHEREMKALCSLSLDDTPTKILSNEGKKL